MSLLTLCDPVDCHKPGFFVFHHLSEFAQTHVHWVSQWCHPTICRPLLLPSVFPSTRVFFNELAQVAKVLEFKLQPSVLPTNIQGWFPLGLTGLISLLSKGLSRVFSSTIVLAGTCPYFGNSFRCWILLILFFSIFRFFIFLFYLQGEALILSKTLLLTFFY